MPLSRPSLANLSSKFSKGESSGKSKKPTDSKASAAGESKDEREFKTVRDTMQRWQGIERQCPYTEGTETRKSTSLHANLFQLAMHLDPDYKAPKLDSDGRVTTAEGEGDLTDFEGMTLARIENALKWGYKSTSKKSDTQRTSRKQAWEGFEESHGRLNLKYSKAKLVGQSELLAGSTMLPGDVKADEEIQNLYTNTVNGFDISQRVL